MEKIRKQIKEAEKRCKELNDRINKSGPESAAKQQVFVVKEDKYW